MKQIIAFFLLIIVSLSAVTPCCTKDSCCYDANDESQANHNPKEPGACSPFFSCATAAGFLIVHKFTAIHSSLIPVKTVYLKHNYTFVAAGFEQSFFQPPRIIS